MAKALARDTKKARLLRLLAEHRGAVPIGAAARDLYGRDDPLSRKRIVHLLGAYRQKDRKFADIRIRGGYIRAEAAETAALEEKRNKGAWFCSCCGSWTAAEYRIVADVADRGGGRLEIKDVRDVLRPPRCAECGSADIVEKLDGEGIG